MPYKKRQDYNQYMQKYMKDWRKQQRQTIKEQRQAMKQLRIQYPKVFNEIFGKPKGSKKK